MTGYKNYRNSELEKLIEASDILKECESANYKEEKEIVIKRLKYIIDNMDKIFEFDSDSLDMESAILSALLHCKYFSLIKHFEIILINSNDRSF